MDPRKRANRSDRRFAPAFEGLEIREVPSSTALIASSVLVPAAAGGAGSGGTGQGSSSPIPLLFRPFTARFQGGFVVGAPRAAGQISQTYMFGGGNSSAFLHGDLQLAYFTPADPTQPVFGQAVMIVKNVANTGNELIVDFTAVPGAVDRKGRPTLFTWTVDPASGGVFSQGAGSGTLRLIYSPGHFPGQGHLHQAVTGGHLGVIFQGTVGTTNLTSTLRNQ
jgi:hypothetical protein